MTAPRSGVFGVTVGFDVEQAVLVVRGEVDALTAPTLGATMGVLVDQAHPNLTLDLAALEFMDAAGLRVIADVAARLATSNRILTIRATPANIRRILDITGVGARVRFEDPDPNVAALGTEQLSGVRPSAVVSRPTELSADLARVGSKPNDSVVDAALRLVTVLAGSTVEGADGVSVTLERRGQLATVASSNDTVLRMDDHQYATGEGPCLAAAAQGHWFYIESLAEEDRWPAFVPRAIEEGIASILSTPLMSAARPVGALNIYSNSERAFGPRQQELAAMFASQASGILIDAGADVIDEALGKRILDALLAREVIARAEGVLMARKHVTAEDAAATLHRSARTAEVAVLQHAAAIVASACDVPGPDA
ncbi:MAG TPA: GAF domain-containing protein [Ilumatobacteraceae bacterium]|nr:GAF domain-containing protein [Ilumatobacteraceae bacterium]